MVPVAIVGIGHSKFGKRSDVSFRELAFEAAKEAFEDAKMLPKDIEYSVIGTTLAEFFENQACPAAVVADYIGLNPQGSVRVEAACATGSAAIRTAYATIASGLADTVLVLGVEKMTHVSVGKATEVMGRSGDVEWEFNFLGPTFPSFYAMMAKAHMNKYGTTEEHLAKIAVKNHHYGALNPLAHLQKEIKLEDVLSSKIVASPLKLFDCSLITDGAAAAILTSGEKARKMTDTPIWIKGLGCESEPSYFAGKPSLHHISGAASAAQQAYKMAKVSPEQIDVANVHDCFTIAELMAYEDLGFAPLGKGAELIDEGQTYVGGKIPVNVDGGLKSKGHPIGATGVSMAVEITKQLRGEAPRARQVNGAEIGLTHNIGQTGQYCYVHVLSR